MSTENRNTFKIKWLFGNREIPVEMFSAVTGLVSTTIGIAALIIGAWQFNISLEKTDEQIAFLKNETAERNAENRPIIRPVEFDATSSEGNWKFSIKFINDGKRQADSMFVVQSVMAYDGNEDLAKSSIIPMYHKKIEKSSGLFPLETQQIIRDFKRIEYDIYLVRFDITYLDVVSRVSYHLAKYYKVNLKTDSEKIIEFQDDHVHASAQDHHEFHKIFDHYFPI